MLYMSLLQLQVLRAELTPSFGMSFADSKEHDIQSSVVTYNEKSSTYSLYQDLELYKCKLLGLLKVGFSRYEYYFERLSEL